nr:uncharacterized protein LOC129421384 [Misgurnus anguillicaudatus]
MDFVLPNGVLSSEIVQHPGPSSEAINSFCFEEEGGDENAENISSGKKTAKSIKRRIAKFFRTMGKKIKSPFVHCFGRNKVESFVPSPELNPGKASDDLVKSEMKTSSGMKADDDIVHPVAKADYDLLNTTKPEDVSSAPQHFTGTSSVSIPQFVIPRADTSLHIVDFSEDDSVDTVLNARTNPANPKPKKPTSSTSDEVLGAIGFTSRMYPKSHESDDKRGFINPCEPKEKTDTNPANLKPKKPTSSTSDEMLGTSGFTSRMYPKSHESDGKQGFINPCEPKEKTDTISANPKPKKPTSSTSDEMLGAIGFTSKVYQEREDSDGKQVAIKQVWEWKHNPYTDIKVNNNSNDANFKTGTIPKTKGFINPYEPKEKMDTNPAKPKPKKPTSSTSDEVVGAIGFTSKVYQEREDSDGKQILKA